jgi:hypothetical protein
VGRAPALRHGHVLDGIGSGAERSISIELLRLSHERALTPTDERAENEA